MRHWGYLVLVWENLLQKKNPKDLVSTALVGVLYGALLNGLTQKLHLRFAYLTLVLGHFLLL